MNQITTYTPNGLDIKAISPKMGDKFSPNLHRWLTAKFRPSRAETSRVFICNNKMAMGALFIGMVHADGWFSGCRLVSVLCQGLKEEESAYSPKFTMVEVPDFWVHYTAIGRCAIDAEHGMGFVGDEQRWVASGDTRHCTWCNNVSQTMRRWSEVVQREAWETTIPEEGIAV